MRQPWTLLLLAISAEVIGTSCLRLSEGMTRPLPTLLVFGAYAIAMALLSKVVLSIPLGLTYALWSGIGTVVIVLVGRFAYGQMLWSHQLIGIGLITAGVVLVNLEVGSTGDPVRHCCARACSAGPQHPRPGHCRSWAEAAATVRASWGCSSARRNNAPTPRA